MTDVSMREMLEAGVHFGHQTRYWNPKMAAYLYGHRNKIHIIDLEKTRVMLRDALNFASRMSANKGTILFVGTKRAAQQIVREEAERCGMPYINLRWLGGLLTNYKTVKQSISRLRELEEMKTGGSMERMNKKEVLQHQRELEKLERNLLGIKDMDGWPDALFVIDVGYEDIAVSEAVKLNIPVIGIVDSNNSPAGVDYVIPGNDDAIRSIRLYTKAVADAIIAGRDSVAHLGAGGDKDEFVELDAEGVPIIETRQEKPQGRPYSQSPLMKGSSTDDELYAKIYAWARRAPEGKVATYGQIAELVGCTAKQVGNAMNALPDNSDVPWHRIINYKGELSPRGGAMGDLEQRRLLEAEGIVFSADGKIDLVKYGWTVAADN